MSHYIRDILGSWYGYEFFRKDGKILASGYNIGRTSYLGWVKNVNALITRNINNKREYARLVKHTTDWKLLHERLRHPRCKRFMEMMKNMEIEVIKEDEVRISDIHRKCNTCIQAKSVKNQNHKPSPKARRYLQHVSMDFWGPHTKAPNLSRIRKPFSKVWFHVNHDDKLEAQAVEGVLIGYCKSLSQYIVLGKIEKPM